MDMRGSISIDMQISLYLWRERVRIEAASTNALPIVFYEFCGSTGGERGWGSGRAGLSVTLLLNTFVSALHGGSSCTKRRGNHKIDHVRFVVTFTETKHEVPSPASVKPRPTYRSPSIPCQACVRNGWSPFSPTPQPHSPHLLRDGDNLCSLILWRCMMLSEDILYKNPVQSH